MQKHEGINDAKNVFSWIARKSFYLENKTDPDLDLGLDLESECSSTFELLKSFNLWNKTLKIKTWGKHKDAQAPEMLC